MSEGRLNALLRLYVHKDIQLDFEEVVTAYGHKHPRRMLLGWPLDAWFSSCWTSSSWSSWSSQWLQILCKYCEYMYKLPLKIRSLIFLKLYPKIVKNAYLRIAIFKISRGSMPPDPLEGARASPRRDRYAITSFGVLEFHAPPPPPPWLKSWIRHCNVNRGSCIRGYEYCHSGCQPTWPAYGRLGRRPVSMDGSESCFVVDVMWNVFACMYLKMF